MPKKHYKRCRRCHRKNHRLPPEVQRILQEEIPILQQEEEVIQAEVQALEKGAQVILGAQIPPVTVRSPKILGPGQANFVVPAGVTRLRIIAYGGGGDGGSLSASGNGCGGGGGGGYTEVFINVNPGQVFICNVGANAQPTHVSSPVISFTALAGQSVGTGRQDGGRGAPIGPISPIGNPFIILPNLQPGTDGRPGNNFPTLRSMPGNGDGGQGGHAFTRLEPIQGFGFVSIGGAGGRPYNNGFPGFGLGAGGGGGGGGFHTSGARGNDGLIVFFW